MNKVSLLFYFLFFCSCESTLTSHLGIESVQVHIPSDPHANYLELIGYFQINLNDQPKEFICTLSSKNETASFVGTLLPGGNIFSIQLNDQLENFFNKDSPIFVKIDSFYGKIEQEVIPKKNVLLQYLQNTIIYDL